MSPCRLDLLALDHKEVSRRDHSQFDILEIFLGLRDGASAVPGTRRKGLRFFKGVEQKERTHAEK